MKGSEIFKKLLSFSLPYDEFDWLENRALSEFEILISVVLTQNTNWKNVLKALKNLKQAQISKLEQLVSLKIQNLLHSLSLVDFIILRQKGLKI